MCGQGALTEGRQGGSVWRVGGRSTISVVCVCVCVHWSGFVSLLLFGGICFGALSHGFCCCCCCTATWVEQHSNKNKKIIIIMIITHSHTHTLKRHWTMEKVAHQKRLKTEKLKAANEQFLWVAPTTKVKGKVLMGRGKSEGGNIKKNWHFWLLLLFDFVSTWKWWNADKQMRNSS